jgi:hypothetical protein
MDTFMQVVVWIGSTVGGAIITLLLTVLFQDKVVDLMARALSITAIAGRGRVISGTWFTYWGIVPESTSSATAIRPSTEIAAIRLRRVGDRVIGSDATKGRNYVVSATLRDGKFLTGTWHDFSNSRYQWGGFQLCWDDEGSGMVGKFVGKDSRNHINHGVWLWARRAESLRDLASWAADAGGYEFDTQAFTEGIKEALAAGSSKDVQK